MKKIGHMYSFLNVFWLLLSRPGNSFPVTVNTKRETTGTTTFLPALQKFQSHQRILPSSSKELYSILKQESKEKEKKETTIVDNFFRDNEDAINNFCQGTNNFWKQLVIEPVRNYVEIQPAGTSRRDIVSKLIAPPEVPGIPRPVWLTILGSVPTALGWYGYYKFSVEEELIRFPMQLLHIPGGGTVLNAAALWILLGQVNLYRRVNELCLEAKQELGLEEPPLYGWWALLPPPLDVVVGLRQVHFLSEFWRIKRGDPYEKDIVAETLFPFISSERFTLKEFVTQPSRWFWFTKDFKDLDLF